MKIVLPKVRASKLILSSRHLNKIAPSFLLAAGLKLDNAGADCHDSWKLGPALHVIGNRVCMCLLNLGIAYAGSKFENEQY